MENASVTVINVSQVHYTKNVFQPTTKRFFVELLSVINM